MLRNKQCATKEDDPVSGEDGGQWIESLNILQHVRFRKGKLDKNNNSGKFADVRSRLPSTMCTSLGD